MKKFIAGLLLGLLISSFSIYNEKIVAVAIPAIVSAKFNETRIVFEGEALDLSYQPLISVQQEGVNGIRNYMPLRAVLNYLGYSAAWVAEDNIIKIDRYPAYIKREYTTSSTVVANTVTMKINQASVTTVSAQIILENDTDFDYTFGSNYTIEKKENNQWVKTPFVKYEDGVTSGFNSAEYYLDRHQTIELDENWQRLYGELLPGEYRMTKNVKKSLGINQNGMNNYEHYTLQVYFVVK